MSATPTARSELVPETCCGTCSAARPGRVQHVVVVVLAKAEVHADPVAKAEQQLELGIVAKLDAPLDADRRPVKGAAQVALLGEQLGEQIAGARRHGIAVRGQRGE